MFAKMVWSTPPNSPEIMLIKKDFSTRLDGCRKRYTHVITHKLRKSLKLDPVWNTMELDSMLFAEKRFFSHRQLGASQTSLGPYGTKGT
jgi:hypothetical protein